MKINLDSVLSSLSGATEIEVGGKTYMVKPLSFAEVFILEGSKDKTDEEIYSFLTGLFVGPVPTAFEQLKKSATELQEAKLEIQSICPAVDFSDRSSLIRELSQERLDSFLAICARQAEASRICMSILIAMMNIAARASMGNVGLAVGKEVRRQIEEASSIVSPD